MAIQSCQVLNSAGRNNFGATNLGDGNIMSLSPPADPLLPAQYFRVVAY